MEHFKKDAREYTTKTGDKKGSRMQLSTKLYKGGRKGTRKTGIIQTSRKVQ